MCENNDAYFNLVERIEDDFSEMDSDICQDLLGTDSVYAALRRERGDIETKYPVIATVMEREGALSLTENEHAALLRYFSIVHEIENMERRQIYFRGHSDGFAYLKRGLC